MYCAIAMRANFSCMVPNESRRRPNWLREAACSTACRMLAFMVPERQAAMPKRPLFRIFIATLKPPPSTRQVHITGHSIMVAVVTVVVAVVDLYSASRSASNAYLPLLCCEMISFQSQSEAVGTLSRVPDRVWKRENPNVLRRRRGTINSRRLADLRH